LCVASLMQEGALSIGSEMGDLARQRLREAIAIYGRAAFEEPRRCEAILRDCCPTAPREVFLLVSALRENVAGELVAQEAGVPEPALLARLTRRLSDHLGLSEDSARWAVESWRYGLEDNPGLRANVLRANTQKILSVPDAWSVDSASSFAREESGNATINWPWLGACFVTIVSCLVALAGTTWITFFHQWEHWPGAVMEFLVLALLLSASGFGELLARRALEQMNPPRHDLLDPRKVPYALLPEVLILLLLPLVALAIPVMWVMEWRLELHVVGLPHGTAFHVIRSFESLLVGAFLYYWAGNMTPIQGLIACSIIRRR
jgi:hypothetical protein